MVRMMTEEGGVERLAIIIPSGSQSCVDTVIDASHVLYAGGVGADFLRRDAIVQRES